MDASGPWVKGRGRVITPRPLGAHVGRVLVLCGLTRGMVVRRTTRHGGALTRSEQNQERYRRVDTPYEVPRPTRTTYGVHASAQHCWLRAVLARVVTSQYISVSRMRPTTVRAQRGVKDLSFSVRSIPPSQMQDHGNNARRRIART